MTKKQAKAANAAWRAALAEGRVVRSQEGMTLTAYPTVTKAQTAVMAMVALGLKAEIVEGS